MNQTSEAVEAKLCAASVAHLATADAEGRPLVVPLCFVYDGRFIYTPLDKKPKVVAPERLARVRHIRANPSVALVIDEYAEDWSRLWYVLVRGKAEVLPESAAEERARAIHLLREKYPQYRSGLLPANAPLIRITPKRITSWGKL